MKTKGIYQIRNLINNKVYIGSSINIETRIKVHKRTLRSGNHINIILQKAYNKYGENQFEYEILEVKPNITPEDLFKLEQHYLDNTPNKYNIAPACGGDLITNHPNRDQIVEKIIKGIKKRYSNMTEEEKIILSNNQRGDKNGNWRGGKTFCGCGRRISGYSNTCAWCRDRTGINNPFYGKKHSKETIEKISSKNTGSIRNHNIPFFIDDVEYRTLKEASIQTNLSVCGVKHRLISDNFENYQYI